MTQDKDTYFIEIEEGDDLNNDPNNDWPRPLPLTAQLLPVEALPPDLLPDPLRGWLVDVAERMRCPLDYVGSAAVVMLSALVGTRLAIKPKQRDNWTVIPNLWGAAVGDPSTMKTPSVTEVFKPLQRLIADAREEHADAMQCYEAEAATYDAQKKVFAQQEQERLKGKTVARPVTFPEPPQKPTERRYMTNDATVEKLAELLNENPTGLLQFRDELVGLLAGWDRSGREQDRAFYLEAWNGSGQFSVDRIGRGTTHVKTVCVALFGGIQPAKLKGYLRAATGYENDGFVQRLQLAVYPDRPTWDYVDDYPDKPARDRAYQVVKFTAENALAGIGYDADEFDRFPYTRFDPAAQEVFKQWLIRWECDVLPGETGLMLEHLTKYRSLMPSLALLFHVVDYAGGITKPDAYGKHLVSERAARLAVRWCDYLMSHARRIYALLDALAEDNARELLRRIKAGALPDGFKVRDVQRKQWSGLTATDEIRAALAELTGRHYLREVEAPAQSTGRPADAQYFISPFVNAKT